MQNKRWRSRHITGFNKLCAAFKKKEFIMTELAVQLVKSLQALGVERVFGIPGGPSIPYIEAMRSHGIEFVLVSNEQSAGIMADVCARLTGIPGVCHATYGPGATNLSTGVAGAFLDRSPLLAFTTEVKARDKGRKVQMNIDHQALYQPITKWTTRLSRENFQETLEKAVRIAVSEVSGPVHIGLPSDIAAESLDSDTFVDTFAKVPMQSPNPLFLKAASKIIKNAKKPILAIGLTAVRLGLQQAIREFVDNNNIPVVVTPMAKGIIPDQHPCYAGVLFHCQSEIVANVYRSADLVIGLGYDPIEFNYESWMPEVPLIHIDTEEADILPEYDVACEVTGSLGVSVAFLNSLILPEYDWDPEKIKANKHRMYEALLPRTNTFTPSDFLVALQEIMPTTGIITTDVGAHLHLIGQLWRQEEPNQIIMTNGWSSMGFGIPSAIAAKICNPDKTVVCVTGDGGFLMNCGELLTARRLGINVVIVVMRDRELSLIKVKQKWENIEKYGTSLYEGEYFAADRFLGVPIFRVENANELKESLPKVLSTRGPAIIEACVDGAVYKNLITRSYK